MRRRSFLATVAGCLGVAWFKPQAATPVEDSSKWDFSDWQDWLEREAKEFCAIECRVSRSPYQHYHVQCLFDDEVCASIDINHELMRYQNGRVYGSSFYLEKLPNLDVRIARSIWRERLTYAMQDYEELHGTV